MFLGPEIHLPDHLHVPPVDRGFGSTSFPGCETAKGASRPPPPDLYFLLFPSVRLPRYFFLLLLSALVLLCDLMNESLLPPLLFPLSPSPSPVDYVTCRGTSSYHRLRCKFASIQKVVGTADTANVAVRHVVLLGGRRSIYI
jgi:hypothetical protein